MSTIQVDGTNFPTNFFLCSDWKFLAIICGIECAMATYSCIWCKCPSSERYDIEKEWSVTDSEKGARNIAEIACSTKPKSRRFSCAHAPLFPTVPIDHVVPDILHLFLRVTDVLFNLLIMDIRRQDGIELSLRSESSVTSPRLSRLEFFLNDTCKIPFKFSICKDTKQLQWKDLMSPEKLVLFEKIILFPQMPKVDEMNSLWKDFTGLYQMLHRKNISQAEADEFGISAKQWVQDFTCVYQTKHVTPYIHLMAMHIPEFLKMYGNLVQFTQQGMEKLNDQITIDFARSINHNYRNLEALRQLMEKKKIEFLEDHGFQRTPRTLISSFCHEAGHNVRTCQQASAGGMQSHASPRRVGEN